MAKRGNREKYRGGGEEKMKGATKQRGARMPKNQHRLSAGTGSIFDVAC